MVNPGIKVVLFGLCSGLVRYPGLQTAIHTLVNPNKTLTKQHTAGQKGQKVTERTTRFFWGSLHPMFVMRPGKKQVRVALIILSTILKNTTMGKYEKGVLGSFHGRVGTVVGSSWKGIQVMKSKSGKRTGKPTQKQVIQQARFAFMGKFISPLAKLLDLTFNAAGVQMSGINLAFRYNYRNALTGTYPAFGLDYSKVLVSKGDLMNAIDPSAESGSGGQVIFNWTDNSGLAQANATDRSILVVYSPENNRALYISNGPVRNAGTGSIHAGIFSGSTVETWLAFISEDGNAVASSVYTGQVVVL